MTTKLTPTEMHDLANRFADQAIQEAMANAAKPQLHPEHRQAACLDATAEQMALAFALRARTKRNPQLQLVPLDDCLGLDDPASMTPPPGEQG